MKLLDFEKISNIETYRMQRRKIMSKWKVIGFCIALVLLVVIGTLMNYTGFKENYDNQQQELVENGVINEEKPTAGVQRKEQDPVLELTQESIELEIGSKFQAIDYIKVAKDQYGYSVKEKVTVDSEIPTDVPGKYEIEYVMDIGTRQITRSMKVEVREMK